MIRFTIEGYTSLILSSFDIGVLLRYRIIFFGIGFHLFDIEFSLQCWKTTRTAVLNNPPQGLEQASTDKNINRTITDRAQLIENDVRLGIAAGFHGDEKIAIARRYTICEE